jgi:hypothetical protein
MSHSNYDVSTWMLHSFNVKENEFWITKRNKLKLQQKSDKERKETENHKRKQITSDFGRKQQMAKDSKKKECHMPNKISLVNENQGHLYVQIVTVVIITVAPALKQYMQSLHKRRSKRGV